jgi:TonB family protein
MNASTMSRTIRWESWQLVEEADRRFRRIVVTVAVPALVLAALSTLWHEAPKPTELPSFDSSQYVELLPDVVPPPPEPVKEAPVEPVKEAVKPLPKPADKPKVQPVEKTPEPAKPVPSARDVAAKTGILALSSQLNDLRDDALATTDTPLNTAAITSKGGIGTTSAASIAAGASTSSGGIGAASADITSSQTGGGVGSRSTGKVNSPLGSGKVPPKGGVAGNDGGRTASDVQAVFNKNQGPFYAIFNRAARENANIGRGKIVIKLTIAANGAVTACSLVSSSYGDAEFERKIIERVKLINFGAKAGPPFTMDYPIQFIPQ